MTTCVSRYLALGAAKRQQGDHFSQEDAVTMRRDACKAAQGYAGGQERKLLIVGRSKSRTTRYVGKLVGGRQAGQAGPPSRLSRGSVGVIEPDART